MNKGLISTRYATALLDYAIASDQQKEVYARMKTLSEVFIQVPRLRTSLSNSLLSREDKKSIILTACGSNVPSSLDKMADLILKNEREEIIQYIALRYIDLYRDRFHIQHGKLITAVPVSEEREKKFLSHIQAIVGENLEVDPVVDPSLIGGFVLHLSDYRWDASVLGELTRIKGKLKRLEAHGAFENKQ